MQTKTTDLKAALAFKKHWIMRQKSYTIQALRFGFGQKYPAMLFFKVVSQGFGRQVQSSNSP